MKATLLLAFINCVSIALGAVIQHDYHNFPSDVVALHMPCEESNMFATKCMCHLKCTDSSCSNAIKLCEKYEKSKGCKYMLVRQIGKHKVATLKRVPTSEEMIRFDISEYPKSSAALNAMHWKKQAKRRGSVSLGSIASSLSGRGSEIVGNIFKSNSSSPLCRINTSGYLTSTKNEQDNARAEFLKDSIALAVLSYHTPMTLANSLRTWNTSGLLDSVAERVALLNDPLPQEHAMALQHGFEVLQPKDIKAAFAKMAKPNVLTIGAAFYYTLQHIQSEYLLFLENDFKIDTTLSLKQIQSELLVAAGMLRNGAEVVRLMSRKYQGCGTFKTCDHHGIHLDSPNPGDRKRNWYAFYCKGRRGSAPYVNDCFHEPDYRCFTSWDSNWSLNAVMVKKSTMLNKKYPTKSGQRSIGEIGLAQFERQDGFEGVMLHIWQPWKVPICISYNGLFIHEEIETST